tara:strand:+ start:241 stop:936 length:696 start_codon:yes stop_codon:yes gene_type:complete
LVIDGLAFSSIADYDTEHEPMCEYYMDTVNHAHDEQHIACATFRMKIVRKYQSQIWGLGFIPLVLSMCTLLVFAQHPSDSLGSRHNVLVTLLLSMVFFEYVVKAQLPDLHYLTFADWYVLGNFANILLVLVMVSIGGYYDVDEWIDGCFFCISAGVMVLYHSAFAAKAYTLRQWELKKIGYDRWDYKKHGIEEQPNSQLSLKGKDIQMDPLSRERVLECPWWSLDDLRPQS